MDIKGTLEREFGLPVTVANDANCMLLGEVWAGAAEGLYRCDRRYAGHRRGRRHPDRRRQRPARAAEFDPLAEKVRASVMSRFCRGSGMLKSAALQNDAGLVGAVYYFKKHHD